MNNNFLERRCSIKRSREESHSNPSSSESAFAAQNDKERPLKRNHSPRNSLVFMASPPSTPKKSSRSQLLGKKNRILTSFKNAFLNSNSSKSVYQSPISDGEASPSTVSSSSSNCSSPSSAESTPFSFYSPPSPKAEIDSVFDFNKKESVCKNLNFENTYDSDDSMNYNLSSLSIQVSKESHPIFHIPEIVSKIITFVDSAPDLPHEVSPIRRRPLSYQHALLIYKDERKAQNIWREACESHIKNNGNPPTAISRTPNSLYSCLLVNKLWYRVTLEVASNKLFFSDERRWSSFVDKTNRAKPQRSVSNTSLFIMHKLTRAKQEDLETVAPSVSGGLEWIEMYICPKVLPPPVMLSGSLLKKLILPGSRVVNDSFLRLVAKNCPKLEVLDLRACELISDKGICLIAQYCNKLISLNLGRHSNGDLITDDSLAVLSRNTKIETLGLAGCSITDRGIWDLANYCSDSLSRLSLNNCVTLTNNSLPRIIKDGYFSRLVVLEIRNILNITDFKPLVNYKKMKEINGHNVLIEGCEVLEYRMREEEWKFEMKKSAKILNDILLWANDPNDGDAPYLQLTTTLNST